MSDLTHAFDFLAAAQPELPTHCAVVGDDRFLKRLVLAKIQRTAIGEDETATKLDGTRVEWRDLVDELCTVSLFGGGPRLVVVGDADAFVSAHRSQLEELIAAKRARGRLVLDLQSLASNTRLYKALAQHGVVIECRPPQTKQGRGGSPDLNRMRAWLRDWACDAHGIRLARGADDELLQLVGAELGLLDQELAKLALFCEQDDEVGVELVRQVVGGWRTKTTWELLDAVLDGHAAAAVGQLERLLQAGEAPQAIAGAVFWSLRRFADAAQAVLEAEDAGRKISLPAALQQAGFKNWPQGALQQAERQIRQIGRIRAGRLYGQLLALDLALKGSHSTPTRTRWALEQFIFSLSRAAAPNA